MVSRRRMIAGGSLVGLSAIAGCQSLLGSGVQEAREHIEAALEDFETAEDEYDEQTETMFDTDQEVSFDTNPILAAIDSARDELSEAEELAGDALADEIAAYRTYADYIEEVANCLEDISAALNHLYSASSYMESARMSEANSGLQQGLNDVDLASEHHDEMERLLSEIEPSYLENEDVGYARMESAVEEMGGYIAGLEHFLQGFAEYTAGYDTLLEAAERYDDADYGGARATFTTAASSFEDATTSFRSGEDDGPQYMHSNFVSAVCLATNARDAAELYAEAAQFAQDGDSQSANQRASDAESALSQTC